MGLDRLMQPPASPSQLRVLIVDDEPSIARHLADGLCLLGFSTLVATSSDECRQILKANDDIGVLITDVRMPGGSGLDLARDVLMDEDQATKLRVVLITGHATIEDATEAIKAGVSDLLRKPFRLHDAERAVRMAMAAAVQRREEQKRKVAREKQLQHLEATSVALANRLAAMEVRPSAPGTGAEREMQELRAISHALRTPLTAITGGAEMLARNLMDEGEAAEWLLAGAREATEAVTLIEELLRTPLSLETQEALEQVSLIGLMNKALNATKDQLEGRSVAISERPTCKNAVHYRGPKILERVLTIIILAIVEAIPSPQIMEIDFKNSIHNGAIENSILFICCSGIYDGKIPLDFKNESNENPYSRTYEGLRFLLARRLAMAFGGEVYAWYGSESAIAMRVLWRDRQA